MLFNDNKPYNDYSSFVKRKFNNRVQKISLNTGFTCPNKDGSKGVGGCTYCNIHTFSPDYCKPSKSISQQLEEGILFFSHKYKTQQYFAYFQSYTNTYADVNELREMYMEAIRYPNVIGLVIGTRPDCISPEIVNILSEIAKTHFVSLDFGVESTLNRTLDIINRCHSFEETQAAYALAANKGLHLGAHLILNLPGESREDMLNHARELSKLPINSLKIHQLQIVKHTRMSLQYEQTPEMFSFMNVDEYIDLVTEFISLLRPEIILERFVSESPKKLLIAPNWGGIKNFEIADKIEKRLLEQDIWQGKFYSE
jgi:uncharacterized protein